MRNGTADRCVSTCHGLALANKVLGAESYRLLRRAIEKRISSLILSALLSDLFPFFYLELTKALRPRFSDDLSNQMRLRWINQISLLLYGVHRERLARSSRVSLDFDNLAASRVGTRYRTTFVHARCDRVPWVRATVRRWRLDGPRPGYGARATRDLRGVPRDEPQRPLRNYHFFRPGRVFLYAGGRPARG